MFPDVVRKLIRDESLPITMADKPVPWKRLFSELEKGELGMVGGGYENADRKRKFLLSQPVTGDNIHVFVNKDNDFIYEQVSDLIGKKGLRTPGSMGEGFDNYAKENLVLKITKGKVLFRMLMANRADYAVTSKKLSEELLSHNPDYRSKVIMKKIPVAKNGIHFVIGKNTRCADMLDKINMGISKLKESGVIEGIVNRYP